MIGAEVLSAVNTWAFCHVPVCRELHRQQADGGTDTWAWNRRCRRGRGDLLSTTRQSFTLLSSSTLSTGCVGASATAAGVIAEIPARVSCSHSASPAKGSPVPMLPGASNPRGKCGVPETVTPVHLIEQSMRKVPAEIWKRTGPKSECGCSSGT